MRVIFFSPEKDAKAYLKRSERLEDNPIQVPEGKSNVIFKHTNLYLFVSRDF